MRRRAQLVLEIASLTVDQLVLERVEVAAYSRMIQGLLPVSPGETGIVGLEKLSDVFQSGQEDELDVYSSEVLQNSRLNRFILTAVAKALREHAPA